MTFTIRQIAFKADGSEIVRPSSSDAPEIAIGRNSDNAIHIADLAVNPIHATVRRLGPTQIEIESASDLNFDIDGRSVSKGTVDAAKGAELGFGGHVITVAKGEAADEIVFSVRRTAALSDSEEEKDEGLIYTLTGLLPGKRVSAWGFGILVILACLIAPVWSWATYRDLAYDIDGERPSGFHADESWSSGALSQAHATLENDCQACHVDAFVSVRDNACLTCHDGGEHDRGIASLHAEIPEQLAARGEPQGFDAILRFVSATFNRPEGSCVECHTEHEGAGAMEPTRQQFCSDCHDGMDQRLQSAGFTTDLGNARDFGELHPQFRPLILASPEGEDPERIRVSLDDNPSEDNGLKFPHDLHLDTTGGVAQMGRRLSARFGFGQSLDCADCHEEDSAGVRYEPVDMEDHCSMCHSLAFDEIDGTYRTLRHGEPDMVRADLRAFYRGTSPRRPINLSSLARQRPGAENSRRTAADYARAVNFRSTRADQAIRQVFTRGGACYDCHTVTPPSSSRAVDYGIGDVAWTDRYFHNGWFSHADHGDNVVGREGCATCHNAAESDEANDLLLPDLAVCRECHVGEDGASLQPVAEADRVDSTCAMCHDYHADDGAPWSTMQDRDDEDAGQEIAVRRRR